MTILNNHVESGISENSKMYTLYLQRRDNGIPIKCYYLLVGLLG